MDQYIGLHALLANLPIWATAIILYAAIDFMPNIAGDKVEDFEYQNAYPAKIRDAALIGTILIAATILQRGGVVLPASLMTGYMHYIFGLISFFLGVVMCMANMKTHSWHLMDIYHDVVSAPFILYSAIMLSPVIYNGGTTAEQVATISCIALWLGIIIHETKANHMNQRR